MMVPLDPEELARLIDAIALLRTGLQSPATMFYTRPFEMGQATTVVIAALEALLPESNSQRVQIAFDDRGRTIT